LPARVAARILLLPLRLAAARAATRDRDALVYLFGRSLVWGLDLRLARARGVRTVAVFLGGDARPPWMDGDHVNADRVRWARVRLRTRLVARRVRAMEELADVVVCHPSYAHFLRRPFVNWLAVAMPVGPGPHRDVQDAEGRPVRVLHAPTRRIQKGTPEIEAAVARLQDSGLAVEYRTLSGLSSGEVRERLAEADVVVDQLWSDTFYAGLSSEAGVAGALPLVFGYPSDLLDPTADALGIPREHFAPPEQLDAQLHRAVTDAGWRERVAAEAASYLRSECAPARVAGRLVRVIDDQVPDEWWVDPGGVDYLDGYGMSHETAAARLRQFVGRYGERALQLPPDGAALAAVRAALRPPDEPEGNDPCAA
jgi:hypothetical protein